MENIYYYLKTLNVISGIPITIIDENGSKEFIDAEESPLFFNDAIQHFSKSENLIDFFSNPLFVSYGIVKSNDKSHTYILGPVKVVSLSRKEIQDYLFFNNIDVDDYRSFEVAHNNIVNIGANKFLMAITQVNIIVNNSIENPFNNLNIMAEGTNIKEYNLLSKKQTILNQDKHMSYDFERTMSDLIQNGDVEGLKNLKPVEFSGRVGKLSNDFLRHFKNMLICLDVICSRAAIKGGADVESVYTYSELNIQKIESLSKIEELGKISQSCVYDYAMMVQKAKNEKITNIYVKKAISIMKNNISNSLDASYIADSVGISVNYLSKLFKQITGSSIPEYFTDLKIDVAKNLLSTTNKKISDIAYYLDFSSQSYFQMRFKKIVGVTPNEYRAEHSIITN